MVAAPSNLSNHSNVVCWSDTGKRLINVGGFINHNINTLDNIFDVDQVNVVVDLMTPTEHTRYGNLAHHLGPYPHVKLISFPIVSKKVPCLEDLNVMLEDLVQGIITDRYRVYIQSVYGCGRSNMVASFLLSRLTGIKDPNYILVAIRDRFATRLSSPKKKFLDSKMIIDFISNNL